MFPVGSIIAFYGDPAWLEGTEWVLCDGRPISQLPEKPDARLLAFLRAQAPLGVPPGHLPNLTDGRFLRGARFETPDSPDRVGAIGGSAEIPAAGEHMHPQTDATQPTALVLQAGRPYGYHFRSTGSHNHGGINNPLFMNVLFIMRYR